MPISPDVRMLGGLALLLFPLAEGPAAVQEREVVASTIAVSGAEASLRLEFADDGRLEIAFREGRVLVDGDAAGTYSRGDALDASWRSLLGRAVALEGAPLIRALREWQPPESMGREAREAAERIDRALEEALSAVPGQAPAPRPAQEPEEATSALVEALLGRSDRLRDLGVAVEGTQLRNLQVRVGEDVVVPAGEEIDGTLLVVDGDLDLHGTVRNDVIVVGGSLRLHEGGTVRGDVRLVDSRLYRDGGRVDGRVHTVSPDRDRVDERTVERIRDELRREIRASVRESTRRREPGFLHPFRHIGRGLAGLVQNLVALALLGLVAAGVIHFARDNLEVVAETARRNAARSAMVGVAGAFLVIPAWILGIVALAVSIIGIPVMLAWIPLFPLAVLAAAVLGYLAVARVLGEWLARQRLQSLDWLRPSNLYHAVGAGLVLLMLAFMAANVIRMGGPFLGFLHALLTAAGVLAGLATTVVGFGAVLLSRGGRRRDFAGPAFPFDDLDWDTAPAGGSTGRRPGGAPEAAAGPETTGEPTAPPREPDAERGAGGEATPEERGPGDGDAGGP